MKVLGRLVDIAPYGGFVVGTCESPQKRITGAFFLFKGPLLYPLLVLQQVIQDQYIKIAYP